MSNSGLCSLGPPGSATALLYVLYQASSAVTKCVKKPAATARSPRAKKQHAPESGKIKLAVPPASSSSARPAISF